MTDVATTETDAVIDAAADMLETAAPIWITAHDRPDGDAAGAALGLARLLRGRGRSARIVGLAPFPVRLRFLLHGELLAPVPPAEALADATVAVLDSGRADRAEAAARARAAGARIVNIDHHRSNERFGDIDWVDPDASSASEMISRLAQHRGWDVPQPAAEALWAGIAYDTGSFTYENTSPACLRTAAALAEAGADPAALARRLFGRKTWAQVRLETRARAAIESAHDGQVAWLSLTRADFEELDCRLEDANDLVNIPRNILGVRISLFFYEVADGSTTKTSIRAEAPFDATELVARFDGGGHARAAGCSISAPLAEAQGRVLDALEALWGAQLGRTPPSHA